MKIQVKTLKGEPFYVEAADSLTVLQLKEKIESEKGPEFFASGLKLIHSGKILADTSTIGECKIKETDFLVAMPGKKPAGGVPSTPAPSQPTPTPTAPSTTTPAPQPISTPSAPSRPSAPPQNTSAGFSDSQIQSLMDMGFTREQVVAALQAAAGDPLRAAEFLAQGGDFDDEGDEEGDIGGPESLMGSPLAPLFANPEFLRLRAAVQSNPQLLPAILQQLVTSQPALRQILNDNKEDFYAFLNTPAEGMMGGPQGGGVQIQVTPEESAAIDRLCALGFDRNLVVQAYFACDKNENLAANYLLQHGGED